MQIMQSTHGPVYETINLFQTASLANVDVVGLISLPKSHATVYKLCNCNCV